MTATAGVASTWAHGATLSAATTLAIVFSVLYMFGGTMDCTPSLQQVGSDSTLRCRCDRVVGGCGCAVAVATAASVAAAAFAAAAAAEAAAAAT